jgi:heme-degrading monooxygenase HmoA
MLDQFSKTQQQPGVGMFVALSRFTIANDMVDEVRAAFRDRAHLVDHAPGFVGMEVMCPVGDRTEIWLVTHWLDEQSYRSWHRGHEYHESHKGIPKGLKLVPGSAGVQLFEVFAD